MKEKYYNSTYKKFRHFHANKNKNRAHLLGF